MTSQNLLPHSLDEVHILYTHHSVDIRSGYTLYSRLRLVLNKGVKHNFAFISLSMASHVSSLGPSKEHAPSMQERANKCSLPAPFMELPFNVYVRIPSLLCLYMFTKWLRTYYINHTVYILID
jgi:hypothetical protein